MSTVILLDRSTVQRKPAWIRVKAPTSEAYHDTRRLMRAKGLHTVCEEAACPTSASAGRRALDGDDPVRHFTQAAPICTPRLGAAGRRHEGLRRNCPSRRHLGRPRVITSVDRDDLPDGRRFHSCVIESDPGGEPGHTI